MKYIPFFFIFEDRDIITKDIEMKESGVKKFSVGHKIGLLYKPKKIISVVDFTKQKNLFVPNGSFVIFSSMLIHGAAIYYDNKIRYSCDFGLLDEKVVDDIKFSFAGDRPQYLSFEKL